MSPDLIYHAAGEAAFPGYTKCNKAKQYIQQALFPFSYGEKQIKYTNVYDLVASSG
jgi:hypothetical protein